MAEYVPNRTLDPDVGQGAGDRRAHNPGDARKPDSDSQMAIARENGPVPVWEQPSPLREITDPRVVWTPWAGLSPRPNRMHETVAFVATEDAFCDEVTQKQILQNVGQWCGFDGKWQWQRDVFRDIMTCFFTQNSDLPAWVLLAPRRITMGFRQERGVTVTTIANEPETLIDGADYKYHRLDIRGHKLSCKYLILEPGSDRRLKDTKIVTQIVRRELRSPSQGLVLITSVTWQYFCLKDNGDATDVLAAKVPSMREFFNEADGTLEVPLLSFCRMSGCMRRIDTLSFNLHPKTGAVLDFRTGRDKLEFNLRSNPNNHVLLHRALTDGCWERL